MAKFPSFADLYKVAGLAKAIIGALPPGTVPANAQEALDVFNQLADHHGVETAAPHDTPVVPPAIAAIAPAPTKQPRKPRAKNAAAKKR